MCQYCENFNDIPSTFYEDAEAAAWAIRFAQGAEIGIDDNYNITLHGRSGLALDTPFSGGLLAHVWALYRQVDSELAAFFEQEGLLYATDANGRSLAELLAYNVRAHSPAHTHNFACANGIDSICHLLASQGVFTPVLDLENGNGFNAATLLYETGNLPQEFYPLVQWELIGDPAAQECDRIKSYILSYDY